MSSTTVITAAQVVATSKEARDKLYDFLVKIVENTRANEPETLRYALCIPDSSQPNADTMIYVFEEYANKAALDTHMSSSPVKDLLDFLATQPSPANLDVKHLSWVPGAFLERPARLPSGTSHDLRSRVENPFVLWATITDPQAADIDTLTPYGLEIVKYAQNNEPDTILYGDVKLQDMTPYNTSDDVKGGFIGALEIYASKAAWVAHLNDDSVKALSGAAHRLGSTFTLVQLNMAEGFLTRE